MEKKKILLTGADGFIGSRIYSALFEKYDDIYPAVYGQPEHAPESSGNRRRNIAIDLTKPKSLKTIPDIHYDVCINAAGSVDQTLPAAALSAINGTGTANLLRRLAETGCAHFIQLSSIAVYGKKVVGTGRDEKTPRKCRGLATIPYGRAKAAAEQYVEESDIPYTILRLPPVIGEFDTALTPVICGDTGGYGRRERGNDGGENRLDFFICGNESKPVTLLSIAELPGYIDGLIQRGPLNDVFNCASHHVSWKELLAMYGEAWRRAVVRGGASVGKKWKYSFLFHLRNKNYLMHAMFSAFGSHFPTDKFERIIRPVPAGSLEPVVEAAVCAYAGKRGNPAEKAADSA